VTRYAAYLETAGDGRCLAHVLDLPGCVVRASSREEALDRLPQAIRDHFDWLRRHGEAVPRAGESIQVEIAQEVAGVGPFDPGDAAALFAPDLDPITPDEMERHFRLMGYARADLLALVRGLSDEVLDWRWYPHVFPIRHVLRHLGNAEEWYVSRLVPPETLPPEWDDDENLPTFEFLEMERRTVLARLRGLTEAERGGVFFPTRWTEHREEAWTARKALRRALEHERQHTAQIRRILSAHRCHLLARLAAERAELLAQLLYLDERTLTGEVVWGQWTARDILAHVAAWDGWEHRAMRCMAEGEAPDLSAVDDFDASNAGFLADRQGLSLEDVLDELQSAREAWVAWLGGLSLETFYEVRSYEGSDWSFADVPLKVQWEHDAHHARRIAGWRERTVHGGESGCKSLLLAALAAAREALRAAAALVPPEERSSRAVCGTWTLKDVLGHIADWEDLGAIGLGQMAAGQAPYVEHIADIDAWNAVHAAARRDQPWEQVWEDWCRARRALTETLAGMPQADLERSYPFPWGPEGTPYGWVAVYVDHDRTHARGLRGST
jgi:predicted RNase H-like HicB family nuclease/uncharacterized damage-inducible protein DinB